MALPALLQLFSKADEFGAGKESRSALKSVVPLPNAGGALRPAAACRSSASVFSDRVVIVPAVPADSLPFIHHISNATCVSPNSQLEELMQPLQPNQTQPAAIAQDNRLLVDITRPASPRPHVGLSISEDFPLSAAAETRHAVFSSPDLPRWHSNG